MPSDVVIAGAGPAGAVAATILARDGFDVSLFDRARFPRPKLCGDTLNPGAFNVLQQHITTAPIVAQALPLDGMMLTGPDVTVKARYGEGTHGYSIGRRTLDQILVEHACAAGAQFEDNTMVLEPTFDSCGAVNGIAVRRGNGRQVEHRARFVIAADGRASRLARAVQLTRHPERPRRWAIGAYFRNVQLDVRFGEMHVRAGYYIGVAPVPGGLTNVCLVQPYMQRSAAWRTPLEMLKDAIRRDSVLRDRFAAAEFVEGPYVLGPMAVDARAAGVAGMLLAGDAAGFIDPITGDGLRFAIAGGVLAAEVARDVLAGRCEPDRAAAVLAGRRHATFSRKWAFNRVVRQLVARPAAVSGAAAAARIMPAAFRTVIRYAGDC